MMATTVIDLPVTVGIAEAASALSVSPDLVRDLIARRELPASKVGARVLIKTSDLERLLLRNRL